MGRKIYKSLSKKFWLTFLSNVFHIIMYMYVSFSIGMQGSIEIVFFFFFMTHNMSIKSLFYEIKKQNTIDGLLDT